MFGIHNINNQIHESDMKFAKTRKLFLNKTNYKIISIDDYSSGSKSNHIKDKRVKYLKGYTNNISRVFSENSSNYI